MLPWVQYCYGDTANPHLWLASGKFPLRSVTGVQQGDPLGPFLFSLALHPIILRTKSLIERTHHRENLLNHPALLAFYLDDGIIVAHHSVLAEALKFLTSNEVKSHGLHLKMDGTKIWWPSIDQMPPNDRNRYSTIPFALDRTPPPNGGGGGISILGSPLGAESFMTNAVCKKADEIQSALELLPKLEDAHTAFSLGRACFGTCRMNFLLRTVPPKYTTEGAEQFDDHMYSFAKYLAGGVLSRTSFAELQLPVSISNPQAPHLGAGLTSATSTAPPAYLASLATCVATAQPLLVMSPLLNPRLLALENNTYAEDAHARFIMNTKHAADNPPSLQDISNDTADGLKAP